MPAVRGAMDAIPPRHIQALFDAPCPAGRGRRGRRGRRARCPRGPGDLVGVLLPERAQQAVGVPGPPDHPGGPADRRRRGRRSAAPSRSPTPSPRAWRAIPRPTRGYLALRARMRVAYRLPLSARDPRDHDGQLRLAGPDRADRPVPRRPTGGRSSGRATRPRPGDGTTVVMRLHACPQGTFAPGHLRGLRDPQALAHPGAAGRVVVRPHPGTPSPTPRGWTRVRRGHCDWSGTLDRPLHLVVG